ncbi:MAG: NapC/NirT family cytochrome c [candidate division Zixibacteria bacterium]|nr:NapC/NirT family cytochrome c [candidate division Zixibacteria bacterium]
MMKKLFFTFLILLLWLTPQVFGQDDSETCLSCHGEDDELEGLNKQGDVISMYVTQASLDSSVHASLDCIECHTDLEGFDDYPHPEQLEPVDCSVCHDEISEIYLASAHGMATNNPNAPSCASCHNSHNILSHLNPNATTSPKNLPYTCSSCHHRESLIDDPDIKITNSFDRYMRSIHAEGISKGIGSAASCNDCHGMHDLQKASDLRSKVNKINIPKTCAKCHNDIYIQYERGIHGKALAAGILDSPNCSDCHGEHEILQISDPTSHVHATNLSEFVCGKCHNDPQLIEKYGFEKERFSSYQDSYHGLATRGKSTTSANCASCHKAHDVLPQSNPASSIHPDNLTKTCQKCHPMANQAFAASYSHNIAEEQYSSINRTVEVIYIIAIVLIIGGMLAHNLIIVFRFIIDKHRSQKGVKTVQRFTGNMIIQHMILSLAFIALAVTGFALKYPDSWWVSVLHFFGIFEPVRSVIHRISAVLLIIISFHHALYLLFTKRGKIELKAIWFTKDDLKQPFQNIKYHLGMSSEKPKFNRYDYTEKAEYWALVWGTFVMAGTGFVLWYPAFFTSFLPAWVVKISEIIHLYEAWLATLAIGVFHLFFVMFHPEQYPMAFTWLTGQMSVSEVKEHHPLWYEKLKKEMGEDLEDKENSESKTDTN